MDKTTLYKYAYCELPLDRESEVLGKDTQVAKGYQGRAILLRNFIGYTDQSKELWIASDEFDSGEVYLYSDGKYKSVDYSNADEVGFDFLLQLGKRTKKEYEYLREDLADDIKEAGARQDEDDKDEEGLGNYLCCRYRVIARYYGAPQADEGIGFFETAKKARKAARKWASKRKTGDERIVYILDAYDSAGNRDIPGMDQIFYGNKLAVWAVETLVPLRIESIGWNSICARLGDTLGSDRVRRPVLRWTPGALIETIHVASGSKPSPREAEVEYKHPLEVWGDDGSSKGWQLLRPMTDEEWLSLLENTFGQADREMTGA